LLYPKENFAVVQEFISNNLSRFCQNGEFINDHVGIGPNKL